MKKTCWKQILSLVLLASLGPFATAQTIPTPTNAPVVSITATDPAASEVGPDTGTLTVWRKGLTNDSLTVWCHIGGTASNGVDYQFISNTVTIPAGAFSAPITVTPISDNLVEGNETVEVAITASPLATIVQYLIGSPRSAVVTIADGTVI